MKESTRIILRSPKKRAGALKVLLLRGFPIGRTLKLLKSRSRKVLLVGSPLHSNLGDHLLALSEKDYLKNCFPDCEIIEIPTCLYLAYKERIVAELANEDVVYITGGGWMGDVWKRDELIMRDMVKSFSRRCDMKVFPQTVYYASEDGDFLSEAREFWSGQDKVTLALREKFSVETCVNDLGISKERIKLLPDAGLLYRRVRAKKSNHRIRRILFCTRTDREAMIDAEVIESAKNRAKILGFEVGETSTLAVSSFPYKTRRSMIEDKLDEFSDADLVVTDRLHGMIFSSLAGTPCVALDNCTKKVRGVYEAWLAEASGVYYIDKENGLEDLFAELESGNQVEDIVGRPDISVLRADWLKMYEGF